jgi:hypothetical protein
MKARREIGVDKLKKEDDENCYTVDNNANLTLKKPFATSAIEVR